MKSLNHLRSESFLVPTRLVTAIRAVWILSVMISLTLTLYSLNGEETDSSSIQVGVAEVDITPDYPVRLSGFGFRREESEGVNQKIWAKALAFMDAESGPAILITTDNLGVPIAVTKEVARRLQMRIGLLPSRLAITASHTHTAPMLTSVAPTLFSQPIPPEHQARIDQYTHEFTDHLTQVALAAYRDIQPSQVSWGIGQVGFATNRRAQGGPVDHDLPTLVVRDQEGQPRAIYFSYACHCVTLSHNHIGGDWVGYAMEHIESTFPGVIALSSIGCGADSNPNSGVTGDKTEIASSQGQSIADEIKRMLSTPLQPIASSPETRMDSVSLDFAEPRSRVEWEERASQPGAVGYHAQVNLERLDRGEALPTGIDYPIQTWNFGSDLAMVFLPGEVVVDYSVQLKKELDARRLWINAYANDAPCYIPSERILKEGGYEGGYAMIYYDQPQIFAPGLEQKIIHKTRELIPETFHAPEGKGTDGIPPKSPRQSMRQLKTHADLSIELVATEPLIASPVAIDWDAQGRMWVIEMFDYPSGTDGDWKPGGRVKRLEDRNADGIFDHAVSFLEGIPFPTGILCWGRGVFICAAPDILYAEDLNDDGVPDKVETVFTGFASDNYQARVNSLNLGLDNWIHGANGLLGGKIQTVDPSADQPDVDIRGHDFRFRFPNRDFQRVAGLTQQGRVRDDWGRWFGCDNGSPLKYYPNPLHYFARNPEMDAPQSIVWPSTNFDGGRVYPISQLLARFNDPEAANRVTSGCGLGIYRDTLLGDAYYNNAFVCEPVHNLVHRMILKDQDGELKRFRAATETESEFLASTDNWHRPVQVKTGPDGALYVVDMYRFLIEHPRWITPERLSELEVRAGAQMGRIYRVQPKQKPLRPFGDLTQLDVNQLALALNSPNGTERDRVQIELLNRNDSASAPVLKKILRNAKLPEIRIQALSALNGIHGTELEDISFGISDKDPHVRAFAIRSMETILSSTEEPPTRLISILRQAAKDSDRQVIQQLAWTLGEIGKESAVEILSLISNQWPDDGAIQLAVQSSSYRQAPAPIQKPVETKSGDSDEMDFQAQSTDSAAVEERQKIIAQYRDLNSEIGDADRGREIYQTYCQACHSPNAAGIRPGPDLTVFKGKEPSYWVQNILDPNAVIEPRYIAYTIQLKNGETLLGWIRNETANSFQVITVSGEAVDVRNTDVKSQEALKTSLMPMGFESVLTPGKMADLLAYLRGE